MILVLQENTTLKDLNLGSNKIGPEGGKAIAKALEVSPVCVLFFRFPVRLPPTPGNRAHFCVCTTQKNTSITNLDLRWNTIGPEGGKAIGKALEVSFVLVSSFQFSCAVTTPPVTTTSFV